LVMALLAAYLSLYTAFFSLGVLFFRKRGLPLVFSAPLLWTILEYLRSHLLTGFPWENLAYSQYLHTKVIQISDITGIYGITLIIVFFNAVLCDLLSSNHTKRFRLAEVIVLGVIIAGVFSYSHFRVGVIGTLMNNSEPLEVSIIQGNIDQNIKWNKQYQSRTIEIYGYLSRQTHSSPGGLIIWPETAAPFYFQQNHPLRDTVVNIAKTTGAALLFGSPSYEEGTGSIQYMNSAFLINPDGSTSGRYDKVHLVPYGEYVPLRRFFPFIGKIVAGVGDFKPGSGYYPLMNEKYRLGVLICYEGIFPEAARAYKRSEAHVLVNITNDAWFGKTSAPYQHLSMTVFRAIENRLYLARGANTGISAIIDPLGNVVSRTEIFQRTALRGTVKIVDEKTFYAAYGDIFVYLCATLLLIAGICSIYTKEKIYVGRDS